MFEPKIFAKARLNADGSVVLTLHAGAPYGGGKSGNASAYKSFTVEPSPEFVAAFQAELERRAENLKIAGMATAFEARAVAETRGEIEPIQ